MMKKLLSVITLFAVICYSVSAMAMTRIKLGVVTKPGSAQSIVAEKFRELIEQASNGNINVQVFRSQSISNETEVLQQIQMNTIQMGIINYR